MVVQFCSVKFCGKSSEVFFEKLLLPLKTGAGEPVIHLTLSSVGLYYLHYLHYLHYTICTLSTIYTIKTNYMTKKGFH